MCLEVGIVLNCYVDVARHSVDLAAEGITSIVVAAAGSVLRDVLKGALIEVDSLVEKASAVLENHNSLLEVVVDLRCVSLDLLLKLIKVLLCVDLHKEKYKAGNDKGEPKEEFKHL